MSDQSAVTGERLGCGRRVVMRLHDHITLLYRDGETVDKAARCLRRGDVACSDVGNAGIVRKRPQSLEATRRSNRLAPAIILLRRVVRSPPRFRIEEVHPPRAH